MPRDTVQKNEPCGYDVPGEPMDRQAVHRLLDKPLRACPQSLGERFAFSTYPQGLLLSYLGFAQSSSFFV